jgi:hypothetical protein
MIRGFVDSLVVNLANQGRVIGWACEIEDPSHRLQVRGRIGDRVLGLSIADNERSDVLSRGIGDGHNGFVVFLQGQLTTAERDLLKIEAKRQDSDDWIELPERRVDGRRAVARFFQEEAAGELWSDSAVETGREDRPVFVMGAARSGTSAVFQSLTRVTRYRGFFEGHVLDIAAAVSKTVDEHFRTKASQIPKSSFYHLNKIDHAATSKAVQAMLRWLASGYTTPYWADKTPNSHMVLSAPILASTWPAARFIFMKRRGIENVLSRQRKFRECSFEYDAEDWAATMAAWRAVRGDIPGKFLELEQVELLRQPVACARLVGDLLALSPDETTGLGEYLRQHRPEVTDPTARIVPNIEDTGWTPDQIATFRRLCHEEMVAYGYTYDERYSKPTAASSV